MPNSTRPSPPDRAGRGPRWPRCSRLLRCCTCGTCRQRIWQRVLRCRRAVRRTELVGVVLRIAGPQRLRHRRQATRGAVGDRTVGATVRHEHVVGAGPAGADGRRGGRRAVRDGAAGGVGPAPCGAAAGLLAGAALAVTPAAVLIFRYNNPDALMVLLMVLAAYCVTRATRTASWRWLALAGVALGSRS